MRYFSVVAVVCIIGGLALMPFIYSNPQSVKPQFVISPEIAKKVIDEIHISLKTIPTGSFVMGNHYIREETPEQKPTRKVLVKAFKLMTHEVTFEQYDRFTALLGKELVDDNGWGRGYRPVINVSWNEAVGFASWLSAITGKKYRLPNEAEWEYACRSNTPLNVHCGRHDVNSLGWNGYNSKGKTHRIGYKLPNTMGLYDMSGNVSEWVQDCWNVNHRYAPKTAIARNDGDCAKRVVKGGSWKNGEYFLKAATRAWSSINQKYNYVGFRLVEEI